jgi:putative flippase GtrA
MFLLLSERSTVDGAVRFVIVGMANTGIGLLCIYLAKWSMGFGDTTANLFGYLIGLAVSFVLNKTWTFAYSGAWWPAFARFLAVFAVAYLCNLATVLVAIKAFFVNSYTAHAIGVVPYTLLFYMGSRYIAFRQTAIRQNDGR